MCFHTPVSVFYRMLMFSVYVYSTVCISVLEDGCVHHICLCVSIHLYLCFIGCLCFLYMFTPQFVLVFWMMVVYTIYVYVFPYTCICVL